MTARPSDAEDAGADRGDGTPAPPDEVVIGLVADPDLPAALADQLHDTLPERLRAAVGDEVTWTVQLVHDPFEEMYPDYGRIVAKAREHVRDTVWDLVVFITDQPMQDESGVVVANFDTDGRVAVVSLPAVGALFMRQRLQALIVPIIASLVARGDDPAGPRVATELRHRLSARRTRVMDAEPGTADVHIVRTGRLSSAHMLGGMVRANRPWRLLLGLSMALAGASAGIAFGVLYSSIWTLATALSALRLAGLTVAAVLAMTGWLIVRHRLWERQQHGDNAHQLHVHLRNASTLITVLIGTVAFVVALFVVALVAAALVIPPTYLADTLGHAVGVSDYLTIAMMATVLGTFAGAVGSGLEDDTEVQEASYGYRESERRRRVEHEADQRATPIRRFRRQ